VEIAKEEGAETLALQIDEGESKSEDDIGSVIKNIGIQ